MPDAKIIDLAPLLTQQLTDLYETSANGTGSFKETRQQDLNFIQNHLTSPPTVVYVSSNGIDSPNRGFINNPYATPDYAISQINDPSTIYILNIIGAYTITNLIIKPNIFIELNNYAFTVTGSVTLDSSWNGVSALCAIKNSSSLSFPSSVNLDFNSIGALSSVLYFTDNTTSSSTSLTITGSPSSTITIIGNDFGFSSEFSYSINNCYGAINGGASANITLSSTSNYSVIGMTILGNLTVTTTGGLSFYNQDCRVIGTALYQTTGSGNLTVSVKSMSYLGGAPKLDNGIGGGQVLFDADVLEQIPILLNGATYISASIGDSINANFSPTQYTPIDSSVTGNLKGIDNLLFTFLADKVLAGDNITIVNNGDSTITVNSSGSSPSGNSDYSGWSFSGSALSTTFGLINTYYPITINSADFSDLVSSNFVNEVVTIQGHPTPVFRYIDDATQFFNVQFNINVRGAVPSQQVYIFQIYIERANTSIVFTGYTATVTLQDLIFPYDISICGIVQLNTGDRVGICVQNTTSTNSLVAVYGNAIITNIDASANAAMTWTDVTSIAQNMSPQNGYVADNAALVTLTLPTIANFGSEIRVLGKGAGGWTIAQNSGQSIVFGSSTSSTGIGGSISSMTSHDCIILTCTITNTQWTAYGAQGSLTVI